MRLKTFLAVAVCVGVIVVALRIRTANDPDTTQYRRIDAFYAEVRSSPSAFPGDVRAVVDYVAQARKARMVSRKKRRTDMVNPDDAPIAAMLQREAAPEQIEAYGIWKKAMREASVSLGYGSGGGAVNPEQRGALGDRFGVPYGGFVRQYFGAPRIGLRHPQPGKDEFYIVRDEPVVPAVPTGTDDTATSNAASDAKR